MRPPCKNCSKLGCGSYHDKCEPYQQWKEETRRNKERERRAAVPDEYRSRILQKAFAIKHKED